MDSIVHLKLFMYGILNNSVCLFGLSGNFLLLYIFFLYKDMRKQSINIYLTVLALYDNGVLIFSIMMLNLPAITDYQQMSTLMGNSNSSTVQLTLTTPVNSFPSTASTYYSSTSSIFYPQHHFAITSTRVPPDTGQEKRKGEKLAGIRPSQKESSMNISTTTRTTTRRATSFKWSTELPSILTVTPSTVLTSIPFHSQPVSSSLHDDATSTFASASALAAVTSTSFTHPIRHQSSTSAAPSSFNHRSKRTKRRLPEGDHYAPTTVSGDFFTFPINSILENCFNLTSSDVHKLKQSMILLNASSPSSSPQPVKQSATPRDLVERLFFEALLRRLILWVRLSLHAKLSNRPPPAPPAPSVSREGSTSTETSMKYSAVTDLFECHRSLLKYYRPEQYSNGSIYSPAERSNGLNRSESTHSAETASSAIDRLEAELDDDKVTSVSLLLLNTLEEIYQEHISTSIDSTNFPGEDHFYADSLTGEDYLSVDVNASINSSQNDGSVLNEEGRRTVAKDDYPPQPGPGSLYPLLYYVKVVYPLALISQSGSIWTTCLITIERYLAVCHPLMSLTLSTRSRAIWALCILSLAAFLFNLPRFAEVDTTGGSIRPSELRRNKLYYHVYYICLSLSLNYILPLSLLFALNIKIYASVRHANAHRNELTRARQSELHLASMLVLIVAIFIACNAPAFLVNCMEPYFEVGTPLLEAITIFSNVLVCFNSAINFVIYCIFGKKFRSKLKQVLGLRGSSCLLRNGSTRNLHGRNRNYFSQRFSTASRNSSFKLTLATHLQGHVNGPPNGSNHLQQQLTGAISPGRQYSYPHTALLADPSLNNDHESAGEEKCEKTVRSASIPLHSLQANGDTNRHEYHHQSHFSDDEAAAIALNTFV